MAFQVYQQHLDLESGFHVIELRDGSKRHLVQIAVGHDSCPACGRVHPKTNLDEIGPKAMVAEVIDSLNQSHANMLSYAERHGLQVK
jgi:uncharacterized protein (UPF0212 family)